MLTVVNAYYMHSFLILLLSYILHICSINLATGSCWSEKLHSIALSFESGQSKFSIFKRRGIITISVFSQIINIRGFTLALNKYVNVTWHRTILKTNSCRGVDPSNEPSDLGCGHRASGWFHDIHANIHTYIIIRWYFVLGMTLNCIHIFIITGSFL